MQVLRPWLVVALVVLVGAGGFAAGYVVRGGAGGPPAPGSSTLSIVAAGTLATLFPEVASALANVTPGASAPASAEEFEGSLAALSAISQLHEPFDVAAAADFRLIPSMLEPTYASWEVVFASTPEVLTYDPSVGALTGINSSNWAQKLTAGGVVLGVANQSTDPNGYNAIFTLELEGLQVSGSLSALYAHFYTTPVGSLAEPNPATTRVEPETQVATLLATHAVSAFITYRSYAVSHGLSFVDLDPRVNLGALDPSDVAAYANASTTILSATGTAKVVGAPVLFAVTVPANAPSPSLGAAFVDYLVSPAGASLLTANAFEPISPAWAAPVGSPLPSVVAPDVVDLPSSLAADLA